ncbi:MAG: PmeII family type II restriction endonuclease [Caldilineaceae bacterium]
MSALPAESARLEKFNTSPFVLMFYCKQKGYKHVSQIEKDILPAKIFSSMETSAGRMVETIALPIYGWEPVPSNMHSDESVLDGRKLGDNLLKLATLKSGSRCLNDEMSKDIASDIVRNCVGWAHQAHVSKIDFSYGVLYGTKKLSNKKDWHVLRNICELITPNDIVQNAHGQWHCIFIKDDVEVEVSIRIGIDWWNYLGNNEQTFIELCVALIRACVEPTNLNNGNPTFVISDLETIVSTKVVPDGYNVGLLQESQYPWLFFLVKHFCDEIENV